MNKKHRLMFAAFEVTAALAIAEVFIRGKETPREALTWLYALLLSAWVVQGASTLYVELEVKKHYPDLGRMKLVASVSTVIIFLLTLTYWACRAKLFSGGS